MNSSFAILQKLKNQFFETSLNKNDYQVAFASLAFSLTNEDFYFLKPNNQTGEEARKFLMEQSEFAFIANSILKNPYIWMLDNENLLYHKYAEIFKSALVADPDTIPQDELLAIEAAKKELFLETGEASPDYQEYKKFRDQANNLNLELIELKEKKTKISKDDILALEKCDLEIKILNEKLSTFQIEWEVKGKKSFIEKAEKNLQNIFTKRASFLLDWNNTKLNKVNEENFMTDLLGVNFLPTTCIPNSICEFHSNIWKKIEIEKPEMDQLTTIFQKEIPENVIATFGNSEPEIQSISFEYCFLEILRPWFDENLIKNNMWMYYDKNRKLSTGNFEIGSEIPAYPIKLILTKNIDLVFEANSRINEDIKNQLFLGNKLLFGNLVLKNIPQNIEKTKLNSFKVHDFTTKELEVLNKTEKQENKANLLSKSQTFSKIQKIRLKEKINIQSLKTSTLSLNSKPPTLKVREFPSSNLEINNNPTILKKTVKSNQPKNTINFREERMEIRPHSTSGIIDEVKINTFSLSGDIKDQNQTPLENCEIILMNTINTNSVSKLTDISGNFLFEKFSASKYLIKIKKKGYMLYEEYIDLSKNFSKRILLDEVKEPIETFQVIGVICKKLPFLPNPDNNLSFI